MPLKKYSLLFFMLSFSTGAFAQTADTAKACNFLGVVQYKNGKAAVVIKATYQGMFRSPDEPILYYLARHKRLKYRDYIRSCCGGTAIEFAPENCTENSDATVRHAILIDLNHLKKGTALYLHCSVYQNIDNSYYNGKTPYFVIDNIMLTNP